MKKYFLLAAILFSANAMASKARVQSLLGANHLIDTQTVFTAPSHINMLNPYLTFEMGAPGTGAEGGIMRPMGAGKILFYLGHQNTTESEIYADGRNALTYIEQRNPLEIIYGAGNMAYGVSLSHGEDKTAGDKETSVVLKWGMNMANDGWLYVHAHVWDQAERRNTGVTDTLKGMPYLTVGASTANSNMRFFGELNYGKWTVEPGATGGTDTDITDMDLTLGVEDRSLKTDTADIYYGLRAHYANRDLDTTPGQKVTGYKLPAFIGIEIPVVSWATFRGSVQQNLLVGQIEDETVPTQEDSIAADTTVAAGLGLKWGNLVLDGTLTAAGDGNINGNQFIANSSVTYNF